MTQKAGLQLLPVESGIPIPSEAKGRHKSRHRWAITKSLRQCSIGDSIFIPAYTQTGVCSSIKQVGYGTFVTRKVGDGVRIWRVE